MKKITFIILVFICLVSYGQNNPDKFRRGIETKFLTLEELTTAERDALVLVEGKQIYNTDTNQVQYYNGSAWVTPSGGSIDLTADYTWTGSHIFNGSIDFGGDGSRIMRNNGGSVLESTFAKLNQAQTFDEQNKFTQSIKLTGNGNISEVGAISIGRAGTDIFSMKKEDNSALLGIDYSALTNNRILNVRDQAGTVALLSDITGGVDESANYNWSGNHDFSVGIVAFNGATNFDNNVDFNGNVNFSSNVDLGGSPITNVAAGVNPTDGVNKAQVESLIAAAGGSGSGALKYTETFGDGSTTSFAITHNLGTVDVIVQLVEVATNGIVFADIVITDANTVTVTFNTAPTTNGYKIIILG